MDGCGPIHTPLLSPSLLSHPQRDTHPSQEALDGERQRLLVVLRDGRKLYGVLRSYDQFGNIILSETVERLYVDLEYAEEYLGVFLVRGENVVLVGEIDEEEFKSVTRRMSRFKRPLESLLPRYKQAKGEEMETKLIAQQLGATDMAEYDAY